MDILNIIKDNFSAIIGVIGTLVGVFIVFILNKISRSGKIKIFQNEIKYTFSERDGFGGSKPTRKITNKTDSLHIDLNIEIYNSSEERKIMRDIKFIVKSNKKEIKTKILDSSTTRFGAGQFITDSLELLNINPKEIIQKKIGVSAKENFQEFLDSNWYITYKNHKQKIKKIKVNKELMEISN